MKMPGVSELIHGPILVSAFYALPQRAFYSTFCGILRAKDLRYDCLSKKSRADFGRDGE